MIDHYDRTIRDDHYDRTTTTGRPRRRCPLNGGGVAPDWPVLQCMPLPRCVAFLYEVVKGSKGQEGITSTVLLSLFED
jgi:hypothetical protein